MPTRVVAQNPVEMTSNSVQRPGIFPTFHSVSKTFSGNTNAFPEMVQDLTRNDSTRNGGMYIESARNGFMLTSDAGPSTSKESPKRNMNSSKNLPEQVTNSSESNPLQVRNSPQTLPGQEGLPESNSYAIPLSLPVQVNSASAKFSQKIEDISKTNPSNRKATFPKWRKNILENQPDLKPSICGINPEAFLNFPGRIPLPVQNAFPDWYCRTPNIEGRGKILLLVSLL